MLQRVRQLARSSVSEDAAVLPPMGDLTSKDINGHFKNRLIGGTY
jgi:hypothetical protein